MLVVLHLTLLACACTYSGPFWPLQWPKKNQRCSLISRVTHDQKTDSQPRSMCQQRVGAIAQCKLVTLVAIFGVLVGHHSDIGRHKQLTVLARLTTAYTVICIALDCAIRCCMNIARNCVATAAMTDANARDARKYAVRSRKGRP